MYKPNELPYWTSSRSLDDHEDDLYVYDHQADRDKMIVAHATDAGYRMMSMKMAAKVRNHSKMFVGYLAMEFDKGIRIKRYITIFDLNHVDSSHIMLDVLVNDPNQVAVVIFSQRS